MSTADRVPVLTEIYSGVDMDDWFEIDVANYVRYHSKRLGVADTYLAMPLLSVAAYLSQHTKSVYVYRNPETGKETVLHVEPTILYTMVVGESGTNKTACLQLLLDILDSIPNVYDAQHTYETGTLDGLVRTLNNNDSCAIGLYDEISTFNDGLDKSGTGSFDRSVYLSLFNGKRFQKSIKTASDVHLKNPRFSLFTFTQEAPLRNFVENNLSNGFFQRFLVSCPPEIPVLMADKIAMINEGKELINLKSVLQKIYDRCVRREEVRLELDEEAVLLYNSHHDYVQRFRMSNENQARSRSIQSKSVGLLLRLAGVANILRNGVNEVNFQPTEMQATYIHDDTINKIDMQRALTIVKCSVETSTAVTNHLTDNSSKTVVNRESRNFIPIPENENMTMDYLLSKNVVRITRKILSKEKVEQSKVNRDKVYPHTKNVETQGAQFGNKFLSGMVVLGLGEFTGNGRQRVFNRINPYGEDASNDDLKKKWNLLGISE